MDQEADRGDLVKPATILPVRCLGLLVVPGGLWVRWGQEEVQEAEEGLDLAEASDQFSYCIIYIFLNAA